MISVGKVEWLLVLVMMWGLAAPCYAEKTQQQAEEKGVDSEDGGGTATHGEKSVDRDLSDVSIINREQDFPICFWQLEDESRYIYRFDMDHLNWREIRHIRVQNRTANQEVKLLGLNVLGPETGLENSQGLPEDLKTVASSVLRDPNGKIFLLSEHSKENGFVKVPQDENLTGRYLLGASIFAGRRDVDNDGIAEAVYLYPKHMISHFKDGGKVGSKSAVFFDDARKMPFEIGPVLNTAEYRYGGNTQSPHREYEMQVKYRNRPLAGAKVLVIAEGSQWRRNVVTDKKGIFRIMPTDDRFILREWQKYLYVATHHDRKENTYHVATLPVVVYKNRPEWRSKAIGFAYWAIIGSALSVLMILGLIRRRDRLNRQIMVIFENHKLKG